MNQRDIFNSLAVNAFDFLHRAIAEFDKAPKYSVIHFCAAVEMLLKARLMMEHWSLVVAKPEQANLESFKEGNFASVTLEETRTRLKNIAGEDIPDIAFGSFQALAKHRNKMIHFYHEGLKSDQKAREHIVSEQCRSWFHLHRLLMSCDGYFGTFSKEIVEADRLLKGHRKYLSAKFKALKSEIDTHRKEGNRPRACSVCKFKAAIPSAFDEQIARVQCLVCDYTETQVEVPCPLCQKLIVIGNEGWAKCGHCGGAVEPEHLAGILADEHAAYRAGKDEGEYWTEANCGNCDGYQTVVRRGDSFFCTNCFDWSDHVEPCEWCTEPNTGDMDDTYLHGCSHCDGMIGWNSDE